MKKAYEVYGKQTLDKHEQSVQTLVERARVYNVAFLQNSALVHDMLAKVDENNELKALRHVSKVWKWLKASEDKARLS